MPCSRTRQPVRIGRRGTLITRFRGLHNALPTILVCFMNLFTLVPMIRAGMPSRTLHVPPRATGVTCRYVTRYDVRSYSLDAALCDVLRTTRSVEDGIPTRSMGTSKGFPQIGLGLVGNAWRSPWECRLRRPSSGRFLSGPVEGISLYSLSREFSAATPIERHAHGYVSMAPGPPISRSRPH